MLMSVRVPILDQVMDPGNRSKTLEVVVSPAIKCKLDLFLVAMSSK